ncbi:MAG: hypothetical protein DSY87_05715 [Methylococcus sp.]|nr:MAG: hypothetical protein DSY87_05715 [Methylococcus sp.]
MCVLSLLISGWEIPFDVTNTRQIPSDIEKFLIFRCIPVTGLFVQGSVGEKRMRIGTDWY